MSTESAPNELKFDYWIPIDIGRFLQDTMDLTTQEIGAYILLLFRYWSRGPLPNDPERLANISRMSADAWSSTYASLSMFFKTGEDGLLHQDGADRRREKWALKRKKAHDKAVKAATARWSKRKAKTGAETDAPSIPQAEHEQCPTSVSTTTPQGDSPSAHPPAPRGDATRPGAPRIPGQPPPASSKSENKAKTTEKARPAPAATVHARTPAENRNGAATGKENIAAHHAKNGSHPQKRTSGSDPRFESCRREVFAFWSGQNPEGGNCPWIRPDRTALKELLAGAPSMTLDQFKKLLRIRAGSEIVASDPPRRWLRDLMLYASGPLDRFKHPLRSRRAL